MTKSIAEDFIISNADSWKIIRTSWLFGSSKNNFVTKIISSSKETNVVKVTDKETGIPTFAKDLSYKIIEIFPLCNGIRHITNIGIATRFEYAQRVLELTTFKEVLKGNRDLSVIRPMKVILADYMNYGMRHWKEALEDYLNSSNS